MRLLSALLMALAPVSAAAAGTGAETVAPILAEAGPGTRWGVVVADETGREILAIEPERRFMPASNTKLFTTAAALWAEARGEGPSLEESGATVRLDGGNVVLTGRGDARLSSRPDCVTNCLAALADAIAARTKRVRDVIGDATLFPDQRWSPGMSWNNIPTSSGTGIAALSVDDNEIVATVSPGKEPGEPGVAMAGYYRLENRAATLARADNTLAFDRAPGERVLRVTGTVAPNSPPVTWKLGVDDPAHYAAWQFAEMLRARGVRVTGAIRSRYCAFVPGDTLQSRCGAGTMAPPAPLAALAPGPLAEVVETINKLSQNLHAELLLRRLGLARGGNGSIADGQAVVSAMMAEAGIAPQQASLSDGSGMSSYNRVTPRATLRLLQWSQRQPWGPALRASLPIGGVDGTLRRRFTGTPLEGRIFAKTGTLNATNALAGWLIAASGRTLAFAIYANDVPEEVRATAIMDRSLLALAAAN
jgi:serine-type D-Ala-D-Ala carboxypeptidase/endopeptidase (penicillin-binding protein 4)